MVGNDDNIVKLKTIPITAGLRNSKLVRSERLSTKLRHIANAFWMQVKMFASLSLRQRVVLNAGYLHIGYQLVRALGGTAIAGLHSHRVAPPSRTMQSALTQ
jgi:hypothetical protein